MEAVKVTLKVTKPQKRFSEAFKKMVVREFEQGLLNKDQLQRKYGLRGNSTVLKWCRKYGKFAYPEQTSSGRPMKDPQKQRIRELEGKLRAAEQKLKIYDKLIEVTNRELDEDIVKKIEAKLHKSLQQTEPFPSASSAGSLATPGKPTTRAKKTKRKKH
jgi:transposase-like protein